MRHGKHAVPVEIPEGMEHQSYIDVEVLGTRRATAIASPALPRHLKNIKKRVADCLTPPAFIVGVLAST